MEEDNEQQLLTQENYIKIYLSIANNYYNNNNNMPFLCYVVKPLFLFLQF
jgi:hypothetical protein